MKPLIAFFAGLIFASGLLVGGMTDPGKILGFLDFFGEWDPTMLFVMMGAIPVFAVFYWQGKKRSSPILVSDFSIPTMRQITPRLVVGSAIFGTGWGLAGLCPGPGLVRAAGDFTAVGFVIAMFVGMRFGDWVINHRNVKATLV